MRNVTRLLAAVLTAALLLTACSSGKQAATSQPEAKSEAPKGTPKDTLVIAMPADIDTMDPAVTMTNATWKVTYPAYDRLVKYKGASTEVEASLATAWETSADGKVWTFKLRKDAKFQDGSPVDAKAVKFTFDRLLKVNKGPAENFPTLDKVEVVDDNTVKFILKAQFAPFLSTLAHNGASIINPKVMEKEKNGDLAQAFLAENAAGSGPYKVVEWQKGQYVKLEANPNWWGGQPKLRTILAKVVKESAAQRLQVEKGDVDIAEGLLVDQYKELAKVPDVAIGEYPSLTVDYVYINNEKPALKDPRVRQALSYAVDYKGIIDGIQGGHATQMRGPVPQGLWGYVPDLLQYSKDTNKAKDLLKQAGASDLKLKILVSDAKSYWEQEALAIQASFQEAGVKAEIEKLANATARQKIDKGDFDLAFGVWSPDFADPFMFMNFWFDSKKFGLPGNRSRYKSDAIDKLLADAIATSDQAVRIKLYGDAQKQIIQEAPYIFLYQFNYMLALRKNIKGFVYNPMLDSMYNFEGMSKE